VYIALKQIAVPKDIRFVVGVNIVATKQRLLVGYWLCAEYIEGAVDSRTDKVYIAVKQTAGPTDILLSCWC